MRSQKDKWFVYLVTCLVTNKSYVGVTSRELTRRWRGHIKSVRNGSKFKFHNAIRKYGARNFERKLLKQCSSSAEAFRVEIRYIAELKTFGTLGYNMTPGGDGVHGIKWKKSSRLKFSKFKKRLLAVPENRAAMKAAAKKAGSRASFRNFARRRANRLWKSKEYRTKITAAQKKAWRKKGKRAAWSKARAADWNKPGYRERMTRSLKRAWRRRKREGR